jgi:tetratricopeptide (TPR) repeat protein
MFGRKRRYDRGRVLADAARAQRKGKARKAVALYREVLGVEPDNVEIHRKVAPLLAQTRQLPEAWASYRRAAAGLVREGLVERAIGVYREAARHLRREVGPWMAIADLELRRGRRADAIQALWTGRRELRSRAQRPQAIRLLERARELDPNGFEVNFELAGLLARSGRSARALTMLEQLAPRASGRALRRVRARQLRISPGPRTLWGWLRSPLS